MDCKDHNSPHDAPAGSFDTEEEAETFALRFATEYIDGRTKYASDLE